jgi:anti-sigma factor RsiW
MSSQPYITCRQLIDLIADYTDGTLAPEPRRECERHLEICPPCVAYLESYELTLRLGKSALADMGEPTEPPELLIRAIRAARAKGM